MTVGEHRAGTGVGSTGVGNSHGGHTSSRVDDVSSRNNGIGSENTHGGDAHGGPKLYWVFCAILVLYYFYGVANFREAGGVGRR